MNSLTKSYILELEQKTGARKNHLRRQYNRDILQGGASASMRICLGIKKNALSDEQHEKCVQLLADTLKIKEKKIGSTSENKHENITMIATRASNSRKGRNYTIDIDLDSEGDDISTFIGKDTVDTRTYDRNKYEWKGQFFKEYLQTILRDGCKIEAPEAKGAIYFDVKIMRVYEDEIIIELSASGSPDKLQLEVWELAKKPEK